MGVKMVKCSNQYSGTINVPVKKHSHRINSFVHLQTDEWNEIIQLRQDLGMSQAKFLRFCLNGIVKLIRHSPESKKILLEGV